MIGHSNKQYLKEEAMKARQAQAMQSFSPPITVNATLFHAPRRVEHNSNTGIMGQINKVLGNYNEGVEEIGKRAGHIYEVRPQSRDANNQQKYKGRLNGVNRPTPTPQHNSNSIPSGRGHDSRHSTSDLPQLMQDESSKSFQNSSSSLPSKESEPVSSHNRNSQHLRPSSASRQPSEKHATEKDGPSSLTYQQKNKYASSYANFNHKSHPSSSSSSSHNHPSGLGSSSGGGGTKSSRPSSSISTDSHHSSKPAVHSSEKHPSSGVSDKHHSNISKTYTDLKAHNEKPHGDARGHATSDGKSFSSSSERTMGHSMLLKGRSLSPGSLPPHKLKSQSQRQGPPLLQPQQTLQQLPLQLQHQQPPTIIPVTTGSDICDENHHSSPSVSPSSVFNATNNIRVKSLPSQLTPQHTSKDSSLPENLFSGDDNDVNRIVREMTSQPEKLTAIKTPIKSAPLGNKTKSEKDKIVSSSDKTTMPKTVGLKNRSRSEVAKNLHGSNMNNLSSDDADLTEMKDKTELDKIIAEMTCIKSPISIILTPEKIKNSQVPFLKTKYSDLAVSDSEGSASDADERRPSDEKPCNGSSSDEEINYKKQLDFSREKEAITQEVKNHMPLMLSPMLDDEPLNAEPLRSQEDLSQDLRMSDSDNESIKSETSPRSQHQPLLLTCNSGGFVIPALSENDSDDEMEGICKNPAVDAHNSEVPDEVATTTDPTHFYGTHQVCAPTARKGSRESPHKISDNEESDDDDDDSDDNEEEEGKETKQIKSEDDTSAAGSEALPEKEADQGSSSSTSCTESTEDESDGSDEEEVPPLKPSPPSHPAKPTTEGEHCDSSSSMSWGLRGFITKPLEIKQPKVTDPQTKSESDNCSSKANSNHSSPSNKYSSDDSSSDSSNQENPSHASLPTASPDKSPLLSDGEELHDGNDSVKRSSISSSGMDEVTPVSKTEILVSDASTKVTRTTSASAVTTSTTWSDTTSSTTKVQDGLGIKIQKENLNSAFTPTPTPMPISSPTSSSVERKRKRKVILLPISINLDLLSSPPEKKRKLSPEPSQPAENVGVVKLEPVPRPQSSSQPRPNAAVDKKIRPLNLQKRGRITSANSRRKKNVIVKIDVKLMNLMPKNCKGGLHPSRKSAISKSPAGLASPSATTKTFTSSSNSGISTPKLASSKQVSTSEITATTATVTSITPKATTPPSLLPPPPTTKVATPPPPSSSSSSTISPNTSIVMATSKTMPPVLVPTSTASTLDNDFNFRIPKRNVDSDSQESRMKMVKIDVQSSKSESKTSDLVKADPSKKSDTAAKKSSPPPPPPLERSFASNKGNKVSKELKLLSTKAEQTCHDINPTPSAAVDENSNSKPNSNDKHLSVPSITFSSNVSSVSSKDMTKATNSSSSNSTPSSSSSAVVQSSSASKLSSSSSGASSAVNITDPRLTVPATTSSSLSTSSNSTFTGDSSRSSSNTSSSTSNSKRSSDAIKSGRPPAKVQLTASSKHKSSANSYFQEATRMKHEGNKKTDIFEKSFLYMQSVVYYVQSGIAMEKSRKEQDCQKMFSETLELLGQIGHYHQYQQEQKLSVLRLMLMSAICKKLYDVKRKVAENLRQVLDEHYKQSSSSTSTTNAHTPSPVRPNLNISTPSSRSTPSPSGSIDSIRSQGSSTSDARLTPSANSSSSTAATTNITSSSLPSSSINPHVSSGTSSSSSSSQTLVIPKRIHSITRNYIDIMDYLAKANHYSEQAAIQRDSCKDFIERLNLRCKTISWQSSISEYVEYVKAGLQLLQDS